MIKENYRLDIPTYFRTTEWAENENISNFYHLFSDAANINEINYIEVDFKNCRWIDPFPIMSLLTLLAQNVIPYSKKILFIFPQPKIKDPYHSNDLVSDQNKVLRFLFKEGFLSILNTLNIETNLNDKDIKLIDDFGDVLNYFDCHLCESKLINTKVDNIEIIINDTILKTEVNLQKRKLSSAFINGLVYKTRVFLTETLDNVKRHAYNEVNSYKYAMTYVRYRYGAKSSINSLQRERLESLIKYERKYYPHFVFSQDSYYDKAGFLEVFVIDVGKGIAESLGLRIPANKWPAQKAFYSVISNDRDKPEKTLIGGLKHIGKILVNDEVLSKDREEWLGCSLPLLKTNTYHEGILPKLTERKHIQGCYWLARISWNNICEIDLKIWSKIDHENFKYLQAVYENEQSNSRELLNNYAFIDERFNPFFDNWSLRNKVYANELAKHKDITIYFSPEDTQKHLITDHILITFIKNLSSETNLFIVDINERETETYISALHRANLPLPDEYRQNVRFLPCIFLITKNLYCCVLIYNKEKNQYIIDDRFTKQFLDVKESEEEISLSQILKAIITFDSLTIWKEVLSLKKLHTFINSNILWDTNTGKHILGYLDFNQLCTVPIFTKLFEMGVLRFMGISSNVNEIQIESIDPLVKNIVNNLKSEIPFKENCEKTKIWIGSVLVAGYIQNEISNINNSGIVLHCFLHPDSEKRNAPRLFIWPQRDWIKKFHTPVEDIYQRLGRTHAIAPYGWKFYKIPRYDKKENSLYFRNPQRSYVDWQSENVGLRIGNYEYDGYYDLFKLDIKYVIEAAFTYYTDLAIYLFVNFFIALGGRNQEQIKDSIMRTKCWGIISQILQDKESMNFYNDVVLIAYPSHYYANIVIGKLSYLLDKDFFDKGNSNTSSYFIDKIVPLNFIRPSNSNSSGLISPLTFDELNQLLYSKNGKKNVILFDDSIVNGRTRKEIKHLLFNQFEGIDEVRTLSIIDRFRLPYDIPNPSKHRSYWRLDVPRLGNNKYNPITDSITKAKDGSRNFTPTAQKIVKRWETGWKKRNSFQDDPSHGLVAEKVTLVKPYKKFGLKYNELKKDFIQIGSNGEDEDKTNRIKIENSIGAAVYVIEAYCLTGRDDIAYNFAMKDTEEIPDKAKIQILCSFLLLFGSELRFSIKKLMLDKLIDIVNNNTSINDSDNENALASLTIINQDKEIIKAIFETACLRYKTFHEDLIIAFAIALPNEIVQEEKFLKRVFLDNTFDKDWNDRKTLHQELFEEGSAHENTFRRFIEQRDGACSQKDLIFCLEQFYDICENLNPYLYEEMFLKNEVLQKINICIQLLKEQTHVSKENPQLRPNLSSLDNILLGIHSHIFFQLSDKSPQKITMIKDNFFINKVLNSLNWDKVAKEKGVSIAGQTNPLVFHTNNLTNIISKLNSINLSYWVPFEKNIMLHFKNILSNVMNGSYQLIESPFGDSIKQKAHLWYNTELDIDKYKFTITFANQVKDDRIDYIRRANNSMKKEKYYSERLQCKTEYYSDPEQEKVLFCKVTLPILK